MPPCAEFLIRVGVSYFVGFSRESTALCARSLTSTSSKDVFVFNNMLIFLFTSGAASHPDRAHKKQGQTDFVSCRPLNRRTSAGVLYMSCVTYLGELQADRPQ